MKDFTKVVRVGRGSNGHVFVTIKYKDGELSLTGVEGPKSNGDCKGSCGQINMSPSWGITAYAPGFSVEIEKQLRDVWGAWHLNHMRAGSPAQRAVAATLPESMRRDYKAMKQALREAGVDPDPAYLHKGKPYAYGSAWLRDDVPEDVLLWLQSLPATDIMPAWN